MSKATKLRTKAQNKKINKDLNNLIEEKLNAKPQSVKSVTPATLSNGQKGVTLTFDPFK